MRVSSATGTVEAAGRDRQPRRRAAPGQFVRVRLLGADAAERDQVPPRAVLEGPQGKFVYVVADSKAQPRPVEVGEQLGDGWIITEGLKPGDQVIVDGVMKHRPRRAGAGGAPRGARPRAGARGAGARAASK